MFKLAMISLAIAAVSGVFAYTDIAAAVPGIAEILFLAFLALFFIALAGWLLIRRRAQSHLTGRRAAPRLRTM
jgi:uncharacterized membrane protein YtjA (UPF0391 family)